MDRHGSQPHNFASHCHSIGEILTIGNQKGIVFCLDESRQHGKIHSNGVQKKEMHGICQQLKITERLSSIEISSLI